jgi:Predicted pPIWI-associating nuclease
MNPAEFIDVLERLHSRLRGGKNEKVSSASEKKNIRSVVGAWFSQYQPAAIQIVGYEQYIRSMDEDMQSLLSLAVGDNSRRTITRSCAVAIRYFKEHLLIPLSRAYWSQAPQRSPAGRDGDVAERLGRMSEDLADSYEQAALDAEDAERLSYRGAAAELREVLTSVLHALAPNVQVEATDWYRESRRSGTRKEPTPTRAERTKFILRSRAKGSGATDAAESYMTSVEERLANVINATYKRGSAATHGGTEREELLQLLPYINALLRELLPAA